MPRFLFRSAAAAVFALGVLCASASAQVAPTLPSDTLQGRKLPPEANIPRQVIAPTLPSDTLKAAERLCAESMGATPVASTPRLPAARSDPAVADTTRSRCAAPARRDTTDTSAVKEDTE